MVCFISVSCFRTTPVSALVRSLAHSNCVNFNHAALRAVLKQENIMASSAHASKTNVRTLRLCVRFKYASFYRRSQSFQSLFG